jgi:hypothetical protein
MTSTGIEPEAVSQNPNIQGPELYQRGYTNCQNQIVTNKIQFRHRWEGRFGEWLKYVEIVPLMKNDDN